MGCARKLIWCNFCGKESADVAQLVAGPGVAICDECIEQAWEIVSPAKRGEIEYASWQQPN